MRRFRTIRTKRAVPRGGTGDQYQYHHHPLCNSGGGTGGTGRLEGASTRPLPWWWPRSQHRKHKPAPPPPEPWPPADLCFTMERALADEAESMIRHR